MTPIKIVICVLCLVLLFSESAFSICLGCKLFNLIFKEKATNCPGGVCEIKQKEPIVQFSGLQKSIVAITLAFSVISLYQFSVNTPNKSMAMNMFSMMDSNTMETTPKVQEDIYDADCVVPQHAIDMGHEKIYKEKFCKKMSDENLNKNGNNSKQPSCH